MKRMNNNRNEENAKAIEEALENEQENEENEQNQGALEENAKEENRQKTLQSEDWKVKGILLVDRC
jgi:hypothetical protein